MRRFFLILPLFCAFAVTAKAQDFYDPYASPARVPDSIRIATVETPVVEHTAIDTIPSSDKYIKIVLYDDFTWEYIDEGHPVIDTAGFYDGWDSELIHAFKGEPLSALPDSVDLLLADELHGYCAPYLAKVHSGFKFRGRRPHYGVDLPLSVITRNRQNPLVGIAVYRRGRGKQSDRSRPPVSGRDGQRGHE